MQGVEPVCQIGGSHGDAVHADEDGVAFACACVYETLGEAMKSMNPSIITYTHIYNIMLNE